MSVEGTDKGGIVRVEDLRVTESGTIRLREVSVSEVADALRAEGYLVIGRDEARQISENDAYLRGAIINHVSVKDALMEWGYGDEADALVEAAIVLTNTPRNADLDALAESSKGVE